MIWVDEKDILAQRAALLPARRESYKQSHKHLAEKKGVLRDFMAATTLSEMRKILYGGK